MKVDVCEKVLNYLRGHNVLNLATSGPDGIWAAAVFYVNEGFTLNFLSAPTTRHAVNIATNARVAATVQEDYSDWREIKGIQLEGTAVRLSASESVMVSAAFTSKFPVLRNPAEAQAELARAFEGIAWYALTATRMYFIDNSVGLGHREQVRLPSADGLEGASNN